MSNTVWILTIIEKPPVVFDDYEPARNYAEKHTGTKKEQYIGDYYHGEDEKGNHKWSLIEVKYIKS